MGEHRSLHISRRNSAFAAAIFSLIAVLAFAISAYARARGADVVGITRAALAKPLRPGGNSVLIVGAQVLPGWHINSNRPFSPDYIPTELKLKLPAGVSAGAVEFPPAEPAKLDFSDEKLSVFTGAVEFRIPLRAERRYNPGFGAAAQVTIDYQACNNKQCLRPSAVSASIDLASAAVAPANPASAASASAPDNSESSFAREFSAHGIVIGFLLVLIGGLALNLTPCVYPLIGVTVAYFGNQGGGPRRVLILAILYVLGIAMMFSSVGVAVALSGGLFGAAMQNPYVLGAIAAMMLALAASSFGLFTIQPPVWMAQWAGAARPGYVGSFLMGLGMGVIAAPCIGPIVLGLLLMVEKSRSALFGFALFFTLAIGLGLPYIGLALAAGSIRRLPRSGEWLAWIEQLFGFVLIGLAVYFLDPVVPHHWMILILPYYAAGVGIFLGFVTPTGRNWRPFLIVRSVIGVAAVVAMIYLLMRPVPKPLAFTAFDPSTLEVAANQRKPVLLDFSADWCIPCREMEHSTFVDPAVVKEASRFITLRADLTAQDKKNAELISKFNIQGVPTTVLIDSNGKIRQQTVGYIGPREMLEDLKQVD